MWLHYKMHWLFALTLSSSCDMLQTTFERNCCTSDTESFSCSCRNATVPFPVATSFRSTSTRDIEFELTDGSLIYGMPSNGSGILRAAVGGTLSCNCISFEIPLNGECLPEMTVYAGGSVQAACNSAGCTDCQQRTTTRIAPSTPLAGIMIKMSETLSTTGVSQMTEQSRHPLLDPLLWHSYSFATVTRIRDASEYLTKVAEHIRGAMDEHDVNVSVPYLLDGFKVLVQMPLRNVGANMVYVRAANGNHKVTCTGCGECQVQREIVSMDVDVYTCTGSCSTTSMLNPDTGAEKQCELGWNW